VDRTDARRQQFARNYFHHDVADPHVFDLVVNIGKLDPDCTAHLIVESLASRFDVQSHSESPPLILR
jgi:cytidylate kinase